MENNVANALHHQRQIQQQQQLLQLQLQPNQQRQQLQSQEVKMNFNDNQTITLDVFFYLSNYFSGLGDLLFIMKRIKNKRNELQSKKNVIFVYVADLF